MEENISHDKTTYIDSIFFYGFFMVFWGALLIRR